MANLTRHLAAVLLSIIAFASPANTQDDVQAEQDKNVLIRGVLQGKVPRASARGILLRKDLFTQCPNNCRHMSDMAMKLSQALAKSGFSQQGWYLVRGGEYNEPKVVVATQIEQIADNGKPKDGRSRWSDQTSNTSVGSFPDFLSTLLKGAPPGRFRAFLFGFSEEPMYNTAIGFQGRFSGMRNALRSGARLPVFKSLNSFSTNGVNCYAFVYEYTVSSVDGSVKFIENSELTLEEHLKSSGIWKALRS